jgi:hypothetical protein
MAVPAHRLRDARPLIRRRHPETRSWMLILLVTGQSSWAVYLVDFISTTSAAESFRSRWGSVREVPVFSSHTSPMAAPQVVQGTANICFAVRSLVFTMASCNAFPLEDVQYCSL